MGCRAGWRSSPLATLAAGRSPQRPCPAGAPGAGEYHRLLPLAALGARGAAMDNSLPPGPRMPAVLQTIGWWSRPTAFLERCRARYGRRFTIRLLGQSPFVVLSDPDEIKVLFQAPPDVLHPGEGARILEPVVGPNSVILLDEGPHLEQRKLMLPSFHGEKMQALAGLMGELAEREVDSWPRGDALKL